MDNHLDIQNVTLDVILPVYNEEAALPLGVQTLHSFLSTSAYPDWRITIVDNGSTDATARVAQEHGARVVKEPRKGYGSACLKGIDELDAPDIVVFIDGDFSDFPEEIVLLIRPIENGEKDFVLGSRMILPKSQSALLPQARYGNRLAVFLIKLFFKHEFTDLGPFRAIRYSSLMSIGMKDMDFGWTVEMQIKAVRNGLRIREVPVNYRKRIGISKITGTVLGTFRAGTKIIYTIFKYLLL